METRAQDVSLSCMETLSDTFNIVHGALHFRYFHSRSRRYTFPIFPLLRVAKHASSICIAEHGFEEPENRCTERPTHLLGRLCCAPMHALPGKKARSCLPQIHVATPVHERPAQSVFGLLQTGMHSERLQNMSRMQRRNVS